MATYALGKVKFINSAQVANSYSVLNIEENGTPTTIQKIRFSHIDWGHVFIKVTGYLFQFSLNLFQLV